MPEKNITLDIKDPRLIPQSLMPLIVFWNEDGNLLSEEIDWKTVLPGISPKSHAMLAINQGKFCVQNMSIFNGYKEVPMEQYMIKGGQLTFVTLVNTNPDFINAFTKSVQSRLTAPWYVTQYDFLGVFVGQGLDNPYFDTTWIHTPGLRYCSVDVLRHLVNACPKLPKPDQLIINGMPREINPELFYKDTLDYSKTFNQYAGWSASTGIVV